MEIASTELVLAQAHDAAAMARMSRDEIERGLDWRWRPPAIRRLIADPEVLALCARCRIAQPGGEPRPAAPQGVVLGGFGIMKFGLDSADLALLAVAPALRRRGLAHAILGWLEKSAHTAGIAEIRLEVRASNGGARKFYAAEGFRRSGYLPGYYQGREAAVRMTKRLGT